MGQESVISPAAPQY